jgi:hypothetical protein
LAKEYYIEIPEGHKSKSATGEQIADGGLQRRHTHVEPDACKGLADHRLEEVVDGHS